VLCVLGTDPTVVRTALRDLGLSGERALAGLVEPLDLQIAIGVSIHDRIHPPVDRTIATQHYPAVADDERRVKHHPAVRADRLGADEMPFP
jgi:hypothetical protein